LKSFWQKALKNKALLISLAGVVILLVVAATADLYVPHDPLKEDFSYIMGPPNREYPCGTDHIGRCIFSRILSGAKNSLLVTFLIVFLIICIGTVLGMTAGFFGGMADILIMRLTDILLAIPTQIFAIALLAILKPGIGSVILAISLMWWTRYARLARNHVTALRQKAFIEEARLGGESRARILFRYIFPELLPELIIMAALDVGRLILAIAGFSFLGLSSKPPIPEWGNMLSEGRAYSQKAPWLLIYPGVAILITVILFNILGDSLRSILSPGAAKKKRRLKISLTPQ